MSDPLTRCSCPLPEGSWGRDGRHWRKGGPDLCEMRVKLQPGDAVDCPMGCGGRWAVSEGGELTESPAPEQCAYRGVAMAYEYCPSYWRSLGCRVLPADPGDSHALAGQVPVVSELLRGRR